MGFWSKLRTLASVGAAIGIVLSTWSGAWAQQKKPNILIIWGDDIGQFNVSAYNMGMMGYKTPNIDRIAAEWRAVHRLVWAAKLHGWSCRFLDWSVSHSHRIDQGRFARGTGRYENRRSDRCGPCSSPWVT